MKPITKRVVLLGLVAILPTVMLWVIVWTILHNGTMIYLLEGMAPGAIPTQSLINNLSSSDDELVNDSFDILSDRGEAVPGIFPLALIESRLSSPDTETVTEMFFFLKEIKDPSALEMALPLLKSEDDYIWLNAAHYMGSCGGDEAVPYLIKALRHSAWRSDEENVTYLQALTGQAFGNDFTKWQSWWQEGHPDAAIDWESNLGHYPRVETSDDVPESPNSDIDKGVQS